jgi:chemotaxis family two-component system response regulator Rcp1
MTKREKIMNSIAAELNDYTVNPYAINAGFRLANLQILLVEDNEADAYLTQRALAGNAKVGEVVLARDGFEALRMIDSGAVRPDLAIVDLRMPVKDGFSFLEDLSTRESAQFPAIVLTSSTSAKDILHSWERGAVEYVAKRDSVAAMAAALDHVISNIL